MKPLFETTIWRAVVTLLVFLGQRISGKVQQLLFYFLFSFTSDSVEPDPAIFALNLRVYHGV